MELRKRIRRHMPVVGSHGDLVGKVDRVEEDHSIALAYDKAGHRHWIPLSWVAWVGTLVHLDRPSYLVRKHWFASPPAGSWREAWLSGQVLSRRGPGSNST